MASGLVIWLRGCAPKFEAMDIHEGFVYKPMEIDDGTKTFSYREIMTATRGFRKKIGQGDFATVYEGTLNGKAIAVKKMNMEGEPDDGWKEKGFRTKMSLISNRRHDNLIQLYGFCHEGSHRLLVLEYMSNGSLEKFLFGQKVLDWEWRIKIAIDIARGLMYLHDKRRGQIIHGDIKPSNILLDENLNAKIADFGIAKFTRADHSRTDTRGYMAPEWILGPSPSWGITASADVYSFGVMLLEIICCRKASDMFVSEGEICLPQWVYECFKDGRLENLAQTEGQDIDIGQFERMVIVVIWCTQKSPLLRPSMEDVEEILEGKNNVNICHSKQFVKIAVRSDSKCGEVVVGRVPKTIEIGDRPRTFSYIEIETATRRFAEKIGRGGFASVYRGTLSDGRSIAVKKLNMEGEPDDHWKKEKVFRQEMSLISNRSHENLVQLYGFCTEGSHRLLVLEYMSNGSLKPFLFGEKFLEWKSRVKIAIDIARGLMCLHDKSRGQIIHRDIKPANILLDHNLHAKIADFGIAKLMRPDQTRTDTIACGTFMYMAPEWRQSQSPTMDITVSVDVYSFGIVLLEMICCREALDTSVPDSQVYLPQWVYECFKKGRLHNLVKMQQTEGIDMAELERMVIVGMLCTQKNPKLRPTMKDVKDMLEGNRDVKMPFHENFVEITVPLSSKS